MKKSLSVIALVAIVLFTFTSCEKSVESGLGSKHKFVDLGLSVKWATCNVGAETPEAYGDYFAWGEIQSKESYEWETYIYGLELKKYNKKDSIIVIDAVDDVATVTWGDDWRIPTKEEQEELINRCKWRWTEQNGVYGYLVMSTINGNSIFLPAGGHKNKAQINKAGESGFYWSSSLHESSRGSATIMYFYSKKMEQTINNRYIGASIRPVRP